MLLGYLEEEDKIYKFRFLMKEGKCMAMERLFEKLKGERIFLMQGFSSLLLLLVTVLFCSTSKGIPEENGIIAATISISIIIFVNAVLALAKEGIEGVFFAFIGSFMAGVAIAVAGARLAFDPSIGSYFLASLVLASILSLSSSLYVIPEKFGTSRIRLKGLACLIFILLLAVLVNFTIIYWVPKIV